MKIEIRALKKSDDRSSFSCGNIELDNFFKKYAGQNQFKHYIGTTYVATNGKSILGFVTVSIAVLVNDDIENILKKRLPNYPLPVLKISRLAVDKKYQNLGIGRKLLKAMFELAIEQKNKTGCIGVVVDAKKEAVSFYKKLGFICLEKDIQQKKYKDFITMFLPISTIEQAYN